MIWCIKTYIIAYVKTQKNKIQSNTSNPTNFRATNPFLVLKLCLGIHLDAKSKMATKITSIPQVQIGLR